MAEQHAAAAATIGGEMTMVAKRSRFPGTPSIALAKGRGVLAVSEVLVTWVSELAANAAGKQLQADSQQHTIYGARYQPQLMLLQVHTAGPVCGGLLLQFSEL